MKILTILCDIDVRIIRILESFCHKLQEKTGKTNYWLASKVLLVSCFCFFLNLTAMIAGFASTAPEYLPIGIILLFFCIFLWRNELQVMYRSIVNYKKLETAAFTRLSKGLANPLRLELLLRRLVMLSILVLDLLSTLAIRSPGYFDIFLMLFVVGLYLLACDPLPPGQEKLWGKIKKLFVSHKGRIVHS